MKKINTKITAVALGAALAVTGLLGGLMMNKSAITASADENDGIMTVDVPPTPTHSFKRYYGMVQYTYTATNCGFMQLSDTTAFLNRIEITATESTGKATYKEIKIPSEGLKTTETTYRYARSAAKDDSEDEDSFWGWDHSEIASVYDSQVTIKTVRTALTSGTTSTVFYTTYDLSASDTENVYITVAYAGECVSYDSNYQVDSSYGDEKKVTVGGIEFFFELKEGKAKVKTSKKITLSDNPNSKDDTGAIVFSV